MALSDAGITAILKGAAEEGEPSVGVPWAVATERMLKGFEDIEFQAGPASALVKLCDAGARYGWREWEEKASPKSRSSLSNTAKRNLRKELRRNLERITRPCLDLERAEGVPALRPQSIWDSPWVETSASSALQ